MRVAEFKQVQDISNTWANAPEENWAMPEPKLTFRNRQSAIRIPLMFPVVRCNACQRPLLALLAEAVTIAKGASWNEAKTRLDFSSIFSRLGPLGWGESPYFGTCRRRWSRACGTSWAFH